MTEYWVSQGNHWCDHCKIFISNNAQSKRTHELGQKHKENVAKRLSEIRKENAAKEKEKQQTMKALEQIEAKAKQSYEKDLAAAHETHKAVASSVPVNNGQDRATVQKDVEWEYDQSSGYYFNKVTSYYYDPNSSLYYSDAIGKWVTRAEAFTSSGKLPSSFDEIRQNSNQTASKSTLSTKADSISTRLDDDPPPGPVLPASKVRNKPLKAAPSSLHVNSKRKRQEKPGHVSSEEAAAIAAREAARKRVQEREKPLMGLYNAY